MFNEKELTNELFDMAKLHGFSENREVTAYIDSLVTSVRGDIRGDISPADRFQVYKRVKDMFWECLKTQTIRRSAKTNVLRWLNTADEILLKVSADSNLSAKIEIAKMLQLDEIRCDETKEMG